MSLLIVGLDVTIVNVALPAIHRSFHASLAGLQWVIDAYTLVLASLLMLAGSTADRIGRKRMFRRAADFVLGSALCALAPSLELLIAARVFQALGGAMLNPVALSIVRNVFHDPRERAQAIGVWGAMFGSASGSGRWSAAHSWTRSAGVTCSWSTCPIGPARLVLTACTCRNPAPTAAPDRSGRAGAGDPGARDAHLRDHRGPRRGWTSARSSRCSPSRRRRSSVLVRYELRRREPLIEVRFFRSAPFAARRDRGAARSPHSAASCS